VICPVSFFYTFFKRKYAKKRGFQRRFFLQKTTDMLREALRPLLCSHAAIAAENLISNTPVFMFV
jgi:hypothetical protein